MRTLRRNMTCDLGSGPPVWLLTAVFLARGPGPLLLGRRPRSPRCWGPIVGPEWTARVSDCGGRHLQQASPRLGRRAEWIAPGQRKTHQRKEQKAKEQRSKQAGKQANKQPRTCSLGSKDTGKQLQQELLVGAVPEERAPLARPRWRGGCCSEARSKHSSRSATLATSICASRTCAAHGVYFAQFPFHRQVLSRSSSMQSLWS
jgi:hypothetical protein